jgi:hypothetical protein
MRDIENDTENLKTELFHCFSRDQHEPPFQGSQWKNIISISILIFHFFNDLYIMFFEFIV